MKKVYFLVLTLLLLFVGGCMGSRGTTKGEPMQSDKRSQENYDGEFMHVNTYTTVVEVINHPTFEGFGRFLFPIERVMPGKEIRLNEINSLLSYHNNINSDATVNVLNYITDEVKGF